MAFSRTSGFSNGFGPAPNPSSTRGAAANSPFNLAHELATRRITFLTLGSGTDAASEMPYKVEGPPIQAARIADVFLKIFPIDPGEDTEDQQMSAWLEYASPGEEIDPTLGRAHPPDAGAVWTQIAGSVLSLNTATQSAPRRLDVSPNDLLNNRRWLRLVLQADAYTGATAGTVISAELWASVDHDIENDALFAKSFADVVYAETELEVPEGARNDLT